ncbi:hypothetical protein EV421DRAFT_2089179 [Armillaria borealis]|uniref:Uncharacterized protein n=1 Tax=Armillaria borealis TaxID=47425 RepID=A0AA39IZN7_9AGAR|nr:hypothetical protein EV421DRAFT_2089179 [Armillaria borealis]
MAQTRAAQSNDECSNESSNRTTWNIIWSCLATIFACTWLAVHPNVPSRYMREKGRLSLSLHRVKHMLLAIICPEVVIMWAFRQRLVASALSKRLMGGFIGKNEHPITAADFFYNDTSDPTRGVILGEIRPGLDISPISSVTKDELMDKSQGDALSKSISLLQTTWFVVQYFSRIILSLPTTPLETATLAFALLNFCNYILWWHKPLDVQYPLNAPIIDESESPFTDSIIPSLRFPRFEAESLVQLPTSTVLEPENAVTSVAESEFNPSGYTDTASGNRPSSPLPSLCGRVWRWYRGILGRILQIVGSEITNKTLPMLWAGQLTLSQTRYSACFGACFGALFGGIHCIGWSSSGFFDSSLEHLLWKISSVLVAIVPVILAFEVLTFHKLRWIILFMRLSNPIFIFVYICARVYLLVDMFLSLRSLPPAMLEEIDWTRYIPHI